MRCIRMWAAGVLVASLPVNATPAIYRCEIGGVVTYEDRPCGADPARYEPDGTRITTYAPPPSTSTPAAAPAAQRPRPRRTAPAILAAEQRKHAEECRRIESALRDIQSKMRSGYRAKEGERLRMRKAQLGERRRAHKCG
jgi:hypothetical protein